MFFTVDVFLRKPLKFFLTVEVSKNLQVSLKIFNGFRKTSKVWGKTSKVKKPVKGFIKTSKVSGKFQRFQKHSKVAETMRRLWMNLATISRKVEGICISL